MGDRAQGLRQPCATSSILHGFGEGSGGGGTAGFLISLASGSFRTVGRFSVGAFEGGFFAAGGVTITSTLSASGAGWPDGGGAGTGSAFCSGRITGGVAALASDSASPLRPRPARNTTSPIATPRSAADTRK